MAGNTIEILIQGIDAASSVINDVTKTAESSFDRLTDSMITSGAAITALAAPAAGAFAAATNSAIDFEEAMTNAQAILGSTADETAALSQQVLDLGANSRAGPQQAAEAFYSIVSGVSDASTHMAILDAAIKTSEAGAAGLTGTTSALIAVMNSYGFAADDAAMVSDVLTTIVGKGVGTMDEFAAALPQVTGLAKTMGVEFDDLGASMALITTKGFSASEASTQLKALMSSMLNPASELEAQIKALGYESGAALLGERGLVGAMELMAAQFDDTTEFAAVFGSSIEATNAALSLAGDGAWDFAEGFKEAVDGATDAAQSIQLDNVAAQTDLLNSQMDALKITVGQALLPALNDLLKSAIPLVESFRDWAAENRPLIAQIAKVVAAVVGLGTGLVGAGSALKLVATAIGIVTSPLGILIGIVTAVGYAIEKNLFGIGDIFNEIVDAVKYGVRVFTAQLSFGKDVFEAFARSIANVLAYVGKALGLISNDDVDMFAEIWADSFTNIVNIVKETIGKVMKIFKDLGRAFGSTFALIAEGENVFYALIDGFGQFIDNLLQSIGFSYEFSKSVQRAFFDIMYAAKDVWDFISAAIPVAIQFVSDAVNNLLIPAFNAAVGFITSSVLPALSKIFNWLFTNIPIGIQFLSEAWTTVLWPALQMVAGFIMGTVVPALVNIFNWLGTNIPIAAQMAADFWNSTLQPALSEVAGFIMGTVVPALGDIANFLMNNIPVAVDFLVGVWNDALKPVLTWLYDWITTYGIPILTDLVKLGFDVLVTAINLLVDAWEGILKPALEALWSFAENILAPALQVVADIIGTALVTAMNSIQSGWENVLKPALQALVDFASAILGPALEGAKILFDNIGSAIETVVGWVNDAVRVVGDLVDILGSIRVPDINLPSISLPNPGGWFDALIPGSPTLLEIGIGQTKAALLDFQRAADSMGGIGMGSPISAPLPSTGGAGGGDVYNIQVFVDADTVSNVDAAKSNATIWAEQLRQSLQGRG